MQVAGTRFAVLLFTDIVGSTDFKQRHGVPAYSAALVTHNGHFERLARECNLTILQNLGDGYFAEARGVAEAVRFALLFQDAMREGPWGEVSLTTRIGIHAGEISAVDSAGGSGIVAPAADLAARVMSVALGGQILLTRSLFDEARHFIREHPQLDGRAVPPLSWLAHGPYLFKGRDEPLEIFEVGAEGLAPLVPPPDAEKAKRAIRPGEEETLGWRPAVGLEIPGRTGWHLTELLGAGGFGEVWAGEHAKLRQRRAFKFCFDDERLRALKREVTLVRLLSSALGERDDIVKIHELKLDAPPFYLESDLAPHGNLLQWAEKQGGLEAIPLATRIALVAHTATALAAAHSIGVLHKDIKPTNILIFDGPDGEPRPRLVDFGIGALADPNVLGKYGVTAAGFTRATIQHSTGTPTYSPPEYLAGRPYTIQGDIFGLGVLLYQLVTAKSSDPLAAGWERDIADLLLREDIAACVDGDPARRLPNAADLAKRLSSLDQRWAEIEEKKRLASAEAALAETEAAMANTMARRKRLRKFAAALLLLASISIAVGWFGFQALASRGPSCVEITTAPPGAEVWSDGQHVGVTPFTENHRRTGQIDYVLKAEGFDDMRCSGLLSPHRILSMYVPLPPKGHEPRVIDSLLSDDTFHIGILEESEGSIEFKQANGVWAAAPRDMLLRDGDIVRAGESSRATITLRNGFCTRMDEKSEVGVSLKRTLLLKGGAFIYTRRRDGEIDIKMPAANAALRG